MSSLADGEASLRLLLEFCPGLEGSDVGLGIGVELRVAGDVLCMSEDDGLGDGDGSVSQIFYKRI